ncbi:DoxX family protein [Paenibacillus tyrfis]|uniref:DoxX family protein n=1 Tax=Paenibacillus tyrfis TaxID=1501230 RepID=UPI00209D6944|nr:DoxX family protein [Paenibacillus tyrfis]MCP1310389.1 DoxX family protein [Paenibacillus tyrfis]
MIMKWLRENVYAAGLLLVLRVYVGWTWLTAGFHKLTGGFDATGFLKGAIAKPPMDKATNELIYPTFNAFIENFALPNAKLINIMIPLGEFLVGLGLILGTLATAAAFFGLMMNFMFLFAGTVSTNPWMVLLGFILLAAGANTGKFGGDYYVLPYLRKTFRKLNKGGDGHDPNKTAGGTRAPMGV